MGSYVRAGPEGSGRMGRSMSYYQPIPFEPLTTKERIAIAVKKGEDPLVAAIDDGLYGTCIIRNTSAPKVAAEIRELGEKVKNGDMESKKLLQTMLMIHLPDLCFPGAEIVGMVRAAETIKDQKERVEA